VRWINPVGDWRPGLGTLEVYTKTPIQDVFKTGRLTVRIPKRWSSEETKEWAAGKYWFQGFPWLPAPRADSALLWTFLGLDDWAGKRVLDFGCHHGYHAFRAAWRGATVLGVDSDPEVVERARIINDHIECADVDFELTTGPFPPEGHWDVVLCLSVLHQIDPTYQDLPVWVELLRTLAPVVWLELINPPLQGKMTPEQVDDIVGQKPVLHYKHRVRCTRSLYRLEGK
jgi:SAM-dependent methyltransferase